MSQRLKNILAFDLAAGATVTLPHGLITSVGRPLVPDVVYIPHPDLSVVATTTTITLTNTGSTRLTGNVLVEAWHTIERSFSDVNAKALVPQPYIVVSVEGGNAPPMPPFAITQTVIYANQAGSDATGNGSQANPYLTFQRAVRDVPAFIPPGARYVINITGLGDETLPEGYELPAWTAGDFIFPFPDNAVTIVASMKPAVILAPSARVFTPTSPPAQNPVAQVWSVDDVAQAWPDLKGYYVTWGDPNDFLFGVIHENTGTSLQFSGDEEPFGEMQIVEPSARLIGNWQIHCSASLLIRGVKFDEVNPGDGSVTISDCEAWMEHCTVFGGFFAAPVYRHYTFSCDLVRLSWNGQFYCSGSRVTDLSAEAFEMPMQMIFKSGTVFENINTITPINLDPTWRFGSNLLVDAVLIKDCLGDGFFWPGGVAVINNCEVNDCQGHAFHFKGPGKYTLTNVTGTGSTGVGIRVDDGAQVELVQPVTVTGADDQETGNLGADAYPVAPFNINDIGVAGTSAGGATGTNARLYSK